MSLMLDQVITYFHNIFSKRNAVPGKVTTPSVMSITGKQQKMFDAGRQVDCIDYDLTVVKL